jgi:hypothetical protein
MDKLGGRPMLAKTAVDFSKEGAAEGGSVVGRNEEAGC